jgi:uncharacterized protein
LLLIVAKEDRCVDRRVARTLEGAAPGPHGTARHRSNHHPTKHNFAAGLDAGVTQIMALIKGEALMPPRDPKKAQPNHDGFMDGLAIFPFIATWL